ncbi:MAG: hypothetical protein ABIS39_08120 [Sphingomicrobium sp.]
MRSWAVIVLLSGLVMPAPVQAVEKSRNNVYALCTVRDVAVKDNQMVGTIYRSSVFSAPASYDSDISMTPERGGKVSEQFEQYLWKSRGLSAGRMSISKGDEHYCIEAPLTLEGKAQLEAMTREWDKSKFPRVELVATDWFPPQREWDRRFDVDLADYEKLLKATRAAHERYRQDIAEVEAKKARDTAAAQAALEKFAQERAAYEAAAAESERQRQAYREEYRRVTGRYPD